MFFWSRPLLTLAHCCIACILINLVEPCHQRAFASTDTRSYLIARKVGNPFSDATSCPNSLSCSLPSLFCSVTRVAARAVLPAQSDIPTQMFPLAKPGTPHVFLSRSKSNTSLVVWL
ncbi:unnamed protein product [Ectocarpus sp. 12 AP-2014]